MKHVVWRPYWDYQKEERWLNSMMAKGFALKDYSWCRYVFEEAPAGAYVYKLDLLKHRPSAPESIAYLRFLEESGVQVVATYMNWVFLRQPSHMGEFQLYTDRESLIAYYQRILKLMFSLIFAEIGIGLFNLIIYAFSVALNHAETGVINLTAGLITLLIGLAMLKLAIPMALKVRDLKREQNLME